MPAAKRLLGPITVSLLCALACTSCGGPEGRRASHIARGERYLADGRPDKARVEFFDALQIAPNDPEARYLSGTVLERLGDLRGAAGMYQGTIDIDPKHLKARARLGWLYLLFQQPDKASELMKPVLATHPNDPDLLIIDALARGQRKEPEAVPEAERAVALAPANERAVAALAGLYTRSGQPRRAIELLQRTIGKVPGSVELRQDLARLSLAENENQIAESQLVEIVRLRPKELAARLQLAAFYTHTKRPDEAERTLAAARSALPESDEAKLAYVGFLYDQGWALRAEAMLRELIAKEPKNLGLQLRLGDLEQRSGAAQQAEATYRAVIARNSAGVEGAAARDRIAALRLTARNYGEAKSLLAEALRSNPHDDDALIMRGTIALEEGDAPAAIADLRTVLRDQPQSLVLLRTLARAYVRNGEPALAEDKLRSALDIAPRDAGVRVDLGRLLVREQRSTEAITVLEEAVRVAADTSGASARAALIEAYLAKPDLAAARSAADALTALQPQLAMGPYLAGLVAERQGRVDEAGKDFEQALRLQPDATDALAALARLRFSHGQHAQAIALARDAIARAPENPVGQDLLGELYLGDGKSAAAISSLTEAVRLAPRWWLPYRNLAHAQLAAGDDHAARSTYERGVEATEEPTLVIDLAQIYERDGRPDDAIHLYEKLHERKPQLELVQNNLAMLLVNHRTDQASLDRARDLTAAFANSKVGPYLDTHGWVMLKRGDVREALWTLQKASAAAPDSREILYHLGIAQLEAGQADKARATLKAALAGGASFDGTEDARVALARLSDGKG